MQKLISALIFSLFAVSAYAADTAPTATPAEKPAAHTAKPHHASQKHQHAAKKDTATEQKADDAAK